MTRQTQELIKRAIAASGLTQTEIAARLGVTKARISQVLNAPPRRSGQRRRGPPSTITMEAFADILQVPLSSLRSSLDAPTHAVMDEYLQKIRRASRRSSRGGSVPEMITKAWTRGMSTPDAVDQEGREHDDYFNGLRLPIADKLHVKLQSVLDLIIARIAFSAIASDPNFPALFRATAQDLAHQALMRLVRARQPSLRLPVQPGSTVSVAKEVEDYIDRITAALRAYEGR